MILSEGVKIVILFYLIFMMVQIGEITLNFPTALPAYQMGDSLSSMLGLKETERFSNIPIMI
jgi:hypothetical protein